MKKFKSIIAKSNSTKKKWLPLWQHSLDTYFVAEYLLERWLSDGYLRNFFRKVGFDNIKKLAGLLALLHDYGKATVTFQTQIVDECDELRILLEKQGIDLPTLNDNELRGYKEMPHSIAGEILLLIKGFPLEIASIIGAHHGKTWANGIDIAEEISDYLEDDDIEGLYRNFSFGLRLWGNKKHRSGWIEIQNEFYIWAMSLVDCKNLNELPKISDVEAVWLSGLIIMADWLASNETYFSLWTYMYEENGIVSRNYDEILNGIKLPPIWKPNRQMDYVGLTKRRFGFEPNEVQKEVINTVINCNNLGILILEAPMGIGKTEAALIAAEEMSDNSVSGMLFALPTQATADNIFSRILEWGAQQSKENHLSIRLAHGLALMNEEYSALMRNENDAEKNVDDYEDNHLIIHEFFNGRKKALLADFVVCTIDQVLMVALKQKHFMLRHLGISGKVVIIDECHAYDSYMNEYLERTLEWLGAYHTPVIMLSATLPSERRSALIDAYLGNKYEKKDAKWRKSISYPLLTWTDGNSIFQKKIEYNYENRKVNIELLDNGNDIQKQLVEIISIINDNLLLGGCGAIILNTVKKAQLVAKKIREIMPEKKVILVHSRFISEDRLEREKKILKHVGKASCKKDRDGVIVVGTQVIEQSMDFDVDILITDLCPMDLLLQRIGRLHRHCIHDDIRPVNLKTPQCYILGAGKELDRGSISIYGEYLLLRTLYFIKNTITIPSDIAVLVQSVYDEDHKIDEEIDNYKLAAEEERQKKNKLKKDADVFRLKSPGRDSTMSCFLKDGVLVDEEKAKAQVRCGDAAVETIVLFEKDEYLTRNPSKYEDMLTLIKCPNELMCVDIAKQSLKLPTWVINNVENLIIPAEWQKSNALRNMPLLILNKNYEKILEGVKFKYELDNGLIIERIERI